MRDSLRYESVDECLDLVHTMQHAGLVLVIGEFGAGWWGGGEEIREVPCPLLGVAVLWGGGEDPLHVGQFVGGLELVGDVCKGCQRG